MTELSGIKRLNVDFDRLSKVAKEKVRVAIQTAGTDVQKDAKAKVPRDTSRLHNSIRNYAEDGGFTAIVDTEAGGNQPVEYGPHVEFGTYKMSAQPFMMPAFEKNTKKLMKELDKMLKL